MLLRDINIIKFNAIDIETKDYVDYNEWLNENGLKHSLESVSKFFDEFFGYSLVQFSGHKDIKDKEIFELNKLKFTIKDEVSYGTVVVKKTDFCVQIEKGACQEFNILPLSYLLETVKAKVEILEKF